MDTIVLLYQSDYPQKSRCLYIVKSTAFLCVMLNFYFYFFFLPSALAYHSFRAALGVPSLTSLSRSWMAS